jgi:hypothetical protein
MVSATKCKWLMLQSLPATNSKKNIINDLGTDYSMLPMGVLRTLALFKLLIQEGIKPALLAIFSTDNYFVHTYVVYFALVMVKCFVIILRCWPYK